MTAPAKAAPAAADTTAVQATKAPMLLREDMAYQVTGAGQMGGSCVIGCQTHYYQPLSGGKW